MSLPQVELVPKETELKPVAGRTRLIAYLFRGGKFMLVAWLGMLVNTACLFLFKGVLGFRIIPASMLAIEIAIIHNFIWYRSWAWKDRRDTNGGFLKQLIKYNIATGAVDFAANISVLWSLSTFFGVHYLLANILGMIAPPFVKFWLNEKLIFRESSHDTPRPNSKVQN